MHRKTGIPALPEPRLQGGSLLHAHQIEQGKADHVSGRQSGHRGKARIHLGQAESLCTRIRQQEHAEKRVIEYSRPSVAAALDFSSVSRPAIRNIRYCRYTESSPFHLARSVQDILINRHDF